ncbi:MAG: hypothetical protein KME17_10685 [Cyanosarcina radialis HA8281-LM2]|nr:hypothetical protein [Cyanosarcina radialis HA8281-LM2]
MEIQGRREILTVKRPRMNDEQNRKLFRQEALERLSSPERLDRLMQVVSPMNWLFLATLGSLVFLALLWGIWGRIPITVVGRGVLICSSQMSQSNRSLSRQQQCRDPQGKAGQIVAINYFPLKDGQEIQAGMPIQITPDTVHRERFGGAIATINSVSTLPVTQEEAVTIVGNRELVNYLWADGELKLEAIALLESDSATFSGYKWSSGSGPKLKISPGMPTTSRITLREVAPISLILPAFGE